MSPVSDKESRTLGRIAQISQIGMEMAIPTGIGIAVDYWLNTLPWFTIAGAILGPILGILHLLNLNRPDQVSDKSP